MSIIHEYSIFITLYFNLLSIQCMLNSLQMHKGIHKQDINN